MKKRKRVRQLRPGDAEQEKEEVKRNKRRKVYDS